MRTRWCGIRKVVLHCIGSKAAPHLFWKSACRHTSLARKATRGIMKVDGNCCIRKYSLELDGQYTVRAEYIYTVYAAVVYTVRGTILLRGHIRS